MGASQATSRTYVDNCIKAGLSVVNQTIAEANANAQSFVEFDLTGCENVNMSHMKISQAVSFDVSATSKALVNNDLSQKISDIISATATAEAQAGLFVAGAESEIITRTVTELTTSIRNLCSSISSSFASMLVNLHMPYCKNIDMSFMTIEQRGTMVNKAAAESEDFNKVKQDLEQQVAAASKASAKGMDITLILIAVVVVALFFVFGGVEFAVKQLLSPYMWFLVSALVTIAGGYLTISSGIGTWPSKKGRDNSTIRTVGLIMGGIGATVAVGSGWLVSKKGGVAGMGARPAAAPVRAVNV